MMLPLLEPERISTPNNNNNMEKEKERNKMGVSVSQYLFSFPSLSIQPLKNIKVKKERITGSWRSRLLIELFSISSALFSIFSFFFLFCDFISGIRTLSSQNKKYN